MGTAKGEPRLYEIDTTTVLEINGTRQRIRLCALRRGLPSVLIVQAGPGLPLLNEVTRFQEHLQLEQSFTVAYWDQRGCGQAARQDALSVTLDTQVDDLGAVIRWLAERTDQPIVLLGISLGATIALQAAAREGGCLKALVAVSVDTDIPASDAATYSFLRDASSQPGQRKIAQGLSKLGAPPYATTAPFQLRARMLTDLGGIEYGKRFGDVMRPLLLSLVRTYGWLGAVAALRNMNAVQRQLLPEMVTFNLLAHWPAPRIPVYYIFGERDPLVPPAIIQRLAAVIGQGDSIATVPDAGHMVHWDAPAIVRSLVEQAHSRP